MTKTHYPFWYGGAASMVAAACTHPLDLAKVRMQTAHAPGANMISTLFNVMKNEGVFHIYKGLSASLLRQATYSTTRFGVYEFLKESVSPDHEYTPPMHVLLPLSMVSGWIGGMVGNPADIANIRMQNDQQLPIERRRNYRNVFDALIRMLKEEGPKSWFRGLIPNCTRGVLMTASQVVTYDLFKKFLININFDEAKRSTHFTASLMAGLVATTVCSPVDVVKTRIMNAHKQHNTTQAQESGIKILTDAVKKEGVTFAFRGWMPSFVRLGPQTIVTFLVLEQLKHSGIGQHS